MRLRFSRHFSHSLYPGARSPPQYMHTPASIRSLKCSPGLRILFALLSAFRFFLHRTQVIYSPSFIGFPHLGHKPLSFRSSLNSLCRSAPRLLYLILFPSSSQHFRDAFSAFQCTSDILHIPGKAFLFRIARRSPSSCASYITFPPKMINPPYRPCTTGVPPGIQTGCLH